MNIKVNEVVDLYLFFAMIKIKIPLYIEFEYMRKPAVVLQSQFFSVPVCESPTQFFVLGSAKKKKKHSHLFQHHMQDSYDYGKSNLSVEKYFNFDLLTTTTDSIHHGAICFKKRQRIKRTLTQGLQDSELRQVWLRESQGSTNCSQRSYSLKKSAEMVERGKRWKMENFKIIRKLEEGSYSKVFLVFDKILHFICVLKVLNKQQIKRQKLIDVAVRELKIHHFFKHKHIVELYGSFYDHQNVYLITEYCANGNLYKYIKQKMRNQQSVDLLEASDLIRQISGAISLMHGNYVMHRDIKPENIFLTLGNVVKVGDFGWSVYYGDTKMRSTQCGTPLYLAPQLIQKQQYSEAVDIWAIGVLTYELLTGQTPFKLRGASDIPKILHQSIKFQLIQNAMARDFARSLLQRDIKLRISIDDVIKHPFIRQQKRID